MLNGTDSFGEIEYEETWGVEPLKILENLVFNEKISPILMPHAQSLLFNVIEAINMQESIPEPDGKGCSNLDAFMNTIKLIDLERGKYLARSYIEIRIEKINQQIYNLSSQSPASLSPILMNHEKSYLAELKRTMDKFLIANLYSQLPESMLHKLVKDNHVVADQILVSGSAPSVDTHVVCMILEDIGEYMIDPVLLLSVTCAKGDIYRMPLKAALQLIMKNQAKLI